MELVHALALARLVSLPVPTAFAHRLPQPTRLPIARSRGFHHAWGTMRWSDDSPGAACHFACAYRVASPGATREPCESSWGHVMVFCTVPPANTLIRWVDERRLRPHSAGSTLPPLADRFVTGWPPSTTARYFSSCPSDSASRRTPCPPSYERWLQVALGCVRLSPSSPVRVLHTFLSSASEELPPLSVAAPLIRAPEDLEPS